MGETGESLEIRWFQASGYDAETEVMSLSPPARDRALCVLKRFARSRRSRFRITPSHVGSILQCRLALSQSEVRVFFVAGKSCVWCIGAFENHSDKDVNHKMQDYLKRSQIAEIL